MKNPKPENYAGLSFEQWRFEIMKKISEMGHNAYLDKAGTVGMFNANHEPLAAAREWLRGLLSMPPQEERLL